MVIVPAMTLWPGVEEVCAWKSIVYHASSVVRLIKTNTLILPLISSTLAYKASLTGPTECLIVHFVRRVAAV